MSRRIGHLSICILVALIILLGVCACSSSRALPTLRARRISAIAKKCQDLFTAEVNAWNAKDAEALRQIYTDDIVHIDGAPLFKGIDAVIEMAREIMAGPAQGKVGQVYISKEECVDAWHVWGIYGFTPDHPGTEFDLLQFKGGKISSWRLFYDQHFFRSGFGKASYINNDLLAQFASSWSAGITDELLRLYTAEATLEDTLFGFSISEQEALKAYIEKFVAKSPGASWELIYPFAEKQGPRQPGNKPLASQGGIFAIKVKDASGNLCAIEAAVILTPDDNGKITAQQVFYNADTLIACGWAK